MQALSEKAAAEDTAQQDPPKISFKSDLSKAYIAIDSGSL
jgi:hypothetical protein